MDTVHNIDKKLIMKDLVDVMSVFKKHNVRAFLAYGAVLGAVRDGDFIPWDDDIDLDIIDPIDLETRKKIGGTLGDLVFKTQPICFNVFGKMEMTAMGPQGEARYDGDSETGIIVCERNFKFSIFFYKPVGEEYVCTPKLGGPRLIAIPTKFYLEPSKLKLHGETFNTAGPHKEYLTHVYGKDWKTPIRDLHAPNCITGKQKRT